MSAATPNELDAIAVRRAEAPADYRACQEVQRRAWTLTDEAYVVPIATMVGANLHGGMVLGAFLPDGTAVGMSFGFLGRLGGRLCHYSQLLGIDPDYQGRGVGARLKALQRATARAEGIEVVAWAFDPLQARNAWFNLETNGATAARYVVDMYGPRTDPLNAGIPTDRLIAEWETEPRPRTPTLAADVRHLPPLIAAQARPDGLLAADGLRPIDPGPGMLLEIPADVNALRARDAALAEAWRRAVRDAFLDAFAAGLRAVGFVRDDEAATPRRFYVLRRGEGASRSSAL